MTEAHDELRKRLTAYRDAKALYESPDPYDREEARYEAMHVAGGRIGHDEALALALLDEHGALLDEVERLRARRVGDADARAHGPEDGMTDAQRLALILAILRAAVASGDARARVLADVEEVARG